MLNIKDLKNLIKQLKKITNINILINNCGSFFFQEKDIFDGISNTYFLNTFVPLLLSLETRKNFNIKKNLVIILDQMHINFINKKWGNFIKKSYFFI